MTYSTIAFNIFTAYKAFIQLIQKSGKYFNVFYYCITRQI